ncbi:hypothetical protein ABN063_02050 [Providencia vermicola]|uniref:hypothetical protein n=1 Tax=Providencia vermicola TaxID=333965 RepID=UPI0032DBEAFF
MSDTPIAPIIDIYWEGPFKNYKEVNEHVTTNERGKNTDYFFYQIYGDHISYGKDVLLYIGMTDNEKGGITSRLKNHNDNWTGGLCSEIKIYIGSYGRFTSWDNWHKAEYYQKIEDQDLPTIKMLESLLIHAHKPSVNCVSKRSLTELKKQPFRLFNTGRRKSLLPELSTTYYTDNPEQLKILEAQEASSNC